MEKHILAVFTIACQEALSDKNFESKRSEIKKLFVQRDFDGIFKNPDLLATYTADYAPSRALCYGHLFQNEMTLKNIFFKSNKYSRKKDSNIKIEESQEEDKENLSVEKEEEESFSIYCIGGGAGSEMIGLASAITPSFRKSRTLRRCTITLQDIGDYRIVLDPLESAFKRLFKHNDTQINTKSTQDELCANEISSLKTTESNQLFVFEHSIFDITDLTHSDWTTKIPYSNLITACFILNEILSASKSKFVHLITNLIDIMKPGSLLLVIDSAGSFSEIELGQQTVMCFHLLDHIRAFECVLRKDSEWYRVPPGLKYRSKLNNMRFYLRLYKKL